MLKFPVNTHYIKNNFTPLFSPKFTELLKIGWPQKWDLSAKSKRWAILKTTSPIRDLKLSHIEHSNRVELIDIVFFHLSLKRVL